jgi:hypothetical protein
MRYQQIKKILNSEISNFLTENHSEVLYIDQFGFKISRKLDNYTGHIGFGKYIRAKGSEYSGGGLSIILNEVEAIVFPLIIKHRLWDTVEPPKDFSISMADMSINEDIMAWRNKFSEIIISSEEDFKIYCGVLKEYLELYALP